MIYIYDIVLNFNKEYFEFFQWKKNDKIINVKKIPVFRVTDEDLLSLKYNIIRVSSDFINKICDLTLFYNKRDNNKYLCLVSNNKETIGLMFDCEGNLIKRSSLLFDEDDEVNEEVCNIEITRFIYLINKNIKIENIARVDKEKKDYLMKFVNNLDVTADENILKYIYYDYFEVEEDDVLKIKDKILGELNSNFDNKLFELVKVLKKIKN